MCKDSIEFIWACDGFLNLIVKQKCFMVCMYMYCICNCEKLLRTKTAINSGIEVDIERRFIRTHLKGVKC